MISTQQFDVKSIILIKTINESQNYSFVWQERIPAYTKFFGLIKVSEVPEGFIESNTLDNKNIDEGTIEKRGYNVRDRKVFYRPYATVYLSHEYQVQRGFKNNQEMMDWVTDLKEKHGGNFEVVNYK
jgi:hypothetical protein